MSSTIFHANAASREAEPLVRRVDRPRRCGQDHARRGAAPAARRRDRARRAARRERRSTRPTSRGASTSRARRCARRCASWRRAAWSMPARIAAPWWRSRRPTSDRNVRGDGGTRSAVRRLCRRADAGGGAPAAGSYRTRNCGCSVHAGDPERFHEVNERFHNAIYAGSQNGYHRRDDAGDAGAGAAVPPRPVPQSRAAREVACRARPRRGRDHARRQRGAAARCARISNWCARIRDLRGVGVVPHAGRTLRGELVTALTVANFATAAGALRPSPPSPP